MAKEWCALNVTEAHAAIAHTADAATIASRAEHCLLRIAIVPSNPR
jgi:hypothetical protein